MVKTLLVKAPEVVMIPKTRETQLPMKTPGRIIQAMTMVTQSTQGEGAHAGHVLMIPMSLVLVETTEMTRKLANRHTVLVVAALGDRRRPTVAKRRKRKSRTMKIVP
jgi:hypothetical protein